MGEDFLRRKNESFVRRRDAHYERFVEPDLFATTHARERTEVVGRLTDGVVLEVGDELWAPGPAVSDDIRFYRGEHEAVSCAGPSVEQLSSDDSAQDGFIARVLEVARDDGLAILETSPVGSRTR